MSRIPSAADRPIPTNEPAVATQQTSETESIKSTDIAGKAPLEAEQVAKLPSSTPEAKGAQYESRLGGLARQSEMQSQFPVPSSPTLKELPELRPNLDPNVHLDEKIDLTKNLPDGMAINKGLEGLDWGPSKAKTGPGHFGVEMTYGGMKAPTDVLAEVRNGGKPSAPNASGPPKDTRPTMTTADGGGKGGGFVGSGHNVNSAPPPGVELSSRAPKYDQLSWTVKGAASAAFDYVKDVVMEKVMPPGGGEAITIINGPALVEEVTGDSKNLLEGIKGAVTGGNQVVAADKIAEDKTMTDPDAGSGEVQLSAEEIGRRIAVRGGATDPVRGSGPAIIEVDKPPVRYGDLVTDPSDTSEAIDGKSTSGNVLIGGGYTDGPNRKDIPVGPPPGGGSGNSNKGDF